MAQNDTIVSDLIFNSMSQEEFDAQMQAETLDPNQFYLTPDTTKTRLDELDTKTTLLESKTTSLDNNKQDVATAVNYDNITNCITEIPQDIKLELKDGVLTLKAGSKVYAGDGVFTPRTITTDLSYNPTPSNGQRIVFTNGSNYIDSIAVEAFLSGATEPTSGLAWFNTNDNKIYTGGAENWNPSNICLPLGIINCSGGKITSIDQVFNGFGYMGSTVFALPEVKGLIPDGRNADGTLKNEEIVTTSVVTTTLPWASFTYGMYLGLNDSNVETLTGGLEIDCKYDKDKNLNIVGGIRRRGLKVITMTTENNLITSLTSKNAFHAVDYNDIGFIAHQAMPSDRYVNLTLGASGSTYIAAADGWLFVSKYSGNTSEYINIVNEKTNFSTATNPPLSGVNCRLFLPVSMGDSVRISYNLSGATNTFRFIYANGAK